jgi:hypothetical protein
MVDREVPSSEMPGKALGLECNTDDEVLLLFTFMMLCLLADSASSPRGIILQAYQHARITMGLKKINSGARMKREK